ncbi:MAG: NUDIX hydrolase [Candidatus Babeliales bacterium]|jgi:isopentenyl-diphosphate delta-isomerase
MSNDEILDLVTSADEVIGQEKRRLVYAQGLSNFRVINGFICNSKKQLWIPRRHQSKKLFPLHLDASVGGHVASGESYLDAFRREAHEELNLDINDFSYSSVARLTPHEHGTSAFMWVYLIKNDNVPPYNPNDFVEYFWLSLEEFFAKITRGDRAKGDLFPILQAIKNSL